MTKPELPHYFICFDCAKERGGRWPDHHRATAHSDECPYCGEVQTLVSTTDFLWNEEKKLKNWD